jgi:hypothetical protein
VYISIVIIIPRQKESLKGKIYKRLTESSALVDVVVVVVCESCCTRSAGLPLRQLGIASTPIKKWAVRAVAGGNSTDERRQSISTFSRQYVRRCQIPVKPKNLKRKDENINKH